MNKMQFDLVTPNKLLCSQKASYVAVAGSEGDFGVLPGHAPFISTLRPGAVVVEEGNKKAVYCVGFGFADVHPEGVTILAEEAIAKQDIQVAAVKTRLQALEKELAQSTSDASSLTRARLAKEKAVLEAQLAVAAN